MVDAIVDDDVLEIERAQPRRANNVHAVLVRIRLSLMPAFGPGLPTWAAPQVVGYLGYTGRRANVAATAAHGPEATRAAIEQGTPGAYLFQRCTLQVPYLVLPLMLQASCTTPGGNWKELPAFITWSGLPSTFRTISPSMM